MTPCLGGCPFLLRINTSDDRELFFLQAGWQGITLAGSVQPDQSCGCMCVRAMRTRPKYMWRRKWLFANARHRVGIFCDLRHIKIDAPAIPCHLYRAVALLVADI